MDASAPVPPLRILAVLPQPADLPRFDAARAGQDLADALKPLTDRGSVILERLSPATEGALRQRLASSPWHVLHFLGHGRTRAAANYGTLAFETADGQARPLNGEYLGRLLALQPTLRLVVLQPADDSGAALEAIAQALVDGGVAAAVSTGLLQGRALTTFAAKLYSGLLRGLADADAVAEARTALNALEKWFLFSDAHFTGASVRLVSRQPSGVLFPVTAETTTTPAPVPPAATAVADEGMAAAAAAKLELKRKRAAGEFDVFLCHNSADKPAVRRLGQRLKERGLLPWLDEWELPPGQAWQPLLEQQIRRIRAAAVCFGAAGVGPWQEQEMYGFLRAFVSRRCPVIPVLLDDAPSQPALPVFLEGMTWVDFRNDDPNPLDRLIWGITGQRPED